MIKIMIAGDYFPGARVADLIEGSEYDSVFGGIKDLISTFDYSIVNLECPVTGEDSPRIRKYGPHLRATPKALEALKYSGIRMVTLANNHIYDYGDLGIRETLETCAEIGIDTIGAGLSLEDAQRTSHLLIKNKRIAIINCCEHEYSIATQATGGANPLDAIENYYHILQACLDSDYLIVIIHGGHENYQLPSPRMKKIYRFFIDAGADTVINHHQHCISGYEIYKQKPIFYGIGNFSFDRGNSHISPWNEGMMIELQLKDEGVDFALHPFIQGANKPGIIPMTVDARNDFKSKLYKLNKIISDEILLRELTEEFFDTAGRLQLRVFEPYTNRILHGLRRRNLFPSLLSKSQLLAIRNAIECESHNDSLVSYLRRNT